MRKILFMQNIFSILEIGKQFYTKKHKPGLLLTAIFFQLLFYIAPSFAKSNLVDFQFTDQDAIDRSGFAARNLLKPFYFDLLKSNAHGSILSRTPFTVDIGTHFNVWFESNSPRSFLDQHARALSIQISSDEDKNVKDKIFFDAVPHASPSHFDISLGNTKRYLTFSFMLDDNYETPKNWLIHMQAWQCCGGHPPFTMAVTPNQNPHSPIEMTFGFRDDISEREQNGKENILFKAVVPRGVWQKISLVLEPHADSSPNLGYLAMWLNDQHAFSTYAHWGYIPGAATQDNHEIKPFIGIDLGVYRRRQKTTQTIYFDEILFSDNPNILFLPK